MNKHIDQIIINIMIIAILAFGIIGSLETLNHVSVPEYTNMTQQQASDQFDHWIDAQIQACRQAGGHQYIIGGGGCDVYYQQPDIHEVVPIENPFWQEWQWIQGGLLALTLILFTVILYLIADIIVQGTCHEQRD